MQHPDTGKILVNFDKEIMQLVREAKYMQRFNIAVPESAQMVLLQEEKFKFYHNQLTHLVREYEHVLGRVAPTIKPLLRPHLDDMERKIAPGFAVLTWTSLNIDGYLHRFKQGLARLEELVRKVVDLTENRVDSNLGAISSTLLVELPTDRSFTYEEFVSTQNRFQKKQAELLAIRNEEVRGEAWGGVRKRRGAGRRDCHGAGWCGYGQCANYFMRKVVLATERGRGASVAC